MMGEEPRMHLERLKISNFRLLQGVDLKFSKQITLVAGPNNVGKSNVADALLLLRDGVSRIPLDGILQQRGGFERVVSKHDVKAPVELAFHLNEQGGNPSFFEVGFDQLGPTYQRAAVSGHTFSLNRKPTSPLTLVGNINGQSVQIPINSNHIFLDPYSHVFRPLTDYFSRFIHIDPFRLVNVATGVGFKEMIASNGADLAQVLHFHHNNDRERFDAYEAAVTAVLPEVEMVETPLVPSGAMVTAKIRFRGAPQKFDLSELSSGIKNVMVLIAAAHFSPPEALLFIEEPENHLHPAAQKGLCAVFKSLAKTDSKQFILTTHSDFVLRQFAPEDCIFFDRAPAGTEAKPLSQIDAFTAWDRLGIDRSLFLEILGRTRQVVVITEGRTDRNVLAALWRDTELAQSILPVRADGGGWKEIVEYAASLRDALSRFRLPVAVYVLLDSDGHRAEKLDALTDKAFDDKTSHVWQEKEIESYLFLRRTLASVSGKPLPDVESAISKIKGRGKEQFGSLLEALGVPNLTADSLMTHCLRKEPEEVPGEFQKVTTQIGKLVGS
jgi:predicted ATPase